MENTSIRKSPVSLYSRNNTPSSTSVQIRLPVPPFFDPERQFRAQCSRLPPEETLGFRNFPIAHVHALRVGSSGKQPDDN